MLLKDISDNSINFGVPGYITGIHNCRHSVCSLHNLGNATFLLFLTLSMVRYAIISSVTERKCYLLNYDKVFSLYSSFIVYLLRELFEN